MNESCGGGTWPEQDAVDEWLDKHDIDVTNQQAMELKKAVTKYRSEIHEKLETERMRLAACGAVALANTRESAEIAREMSPGYHSASLNDVIRAVDREMKYREALRELLNDCINFDGGKLTDVIMKQASDALAET